MRLKWPDDASWALDGGRGNEAGGIGNYAATAAALKLSWAVSRVPKVDLNFWIACGTQQVASRLHATVRLKQLRNDAIKCLILISALYKLHKLLTDGRATPWTGRQ